MLKLLRIVYCEIQVKENKCTIYNLSRVISARVNLLKHRLKGNFHDIFDLFSSKGKLILNAMETNKKIFCKTKKAAELN